MAQPYPKSFFPKSLQDFLVSEKCDPESLTFLAGDASPRMYYRVNAETGSRVLMISEEDRTKNESFLKVAALLRERGFHAPEVYGESPQQGYYLLEDLGNLTFTRALKMDVGEENLYHLATEGLIQIRESFQKNTADLPLYDVEKFYEEAALLIDWYAPEVEVPLSREARTSYQDIWRTLYAHQPAVPATVVLRDYMVDNLMWIPEKMGMQRLGLLDFQDALWGPLTYDLVSLLEDARRDVSEDVARKMLALYRASCPDLSLEDFDHSYCLWGAQRSSKIIGIFTRLAKRDGKSQYLDFIPRVWKILERDLAHPALHPLRTWFDDHIPFPLRKKPSC